MNSDGTSTFATGYGDITVNNEFLNNSYIGADLSDVNTDHPNYHEYSTTYNLGYSVDQVDLQIVQDALAEFPTPTSQTVLSPGAYGADRWSFAGPGYVTHHWTNPSTVLNVTTDLHALDPGVVQRQIVVINGQYHIVTIGNGIGIQPQINVDWAAGVWGFTDLLIGGYILNETGISPTDPGHTSVNGQAPYCFKSDTPIQMWPLDPSIKPRADGSYDEQLVLSRVWEKPISEIRVGDLVISYDDKGRIKPGPVKRTMTNTATHLLDFWSTGVTPGHGYYCADGKFKDQHVPLMDILRTDGAIMRADGTMIRAATNCKVGSMGDMMIHVAVTMQKPDASSTGLKLGKLRFGTRIILSDGRDTSLMELAHEEGWRVSGDGYMVGTVKGADGTVTERVFHFPYCFGPELPKPEEYILKRSAVTLEEIYLANEWEQIGTRMPAPESVASFNPNSAMNQSNPKPNVPPAFANRPDVPIAERSARRLGSATVLPSVPAK
ncbi:hypothetical protein [Mameliella alba]|uniref:hypothetical protein n=1 Tax=Mameliella alba TaxID=561184 RepID=UPI0010561FC3|nr:hypothetical protein [Mameliella alba]